MPFPIDLTTGGCNRPTSLIEAASSANCSSSKTVRGCFGFGEIKLISTSLRSATTTPLGVVISGGIIDAGINASKPRPNPPLRADIYEALSFVNLGVKLFIGAPPRFAISRATLK